MKNLNLALIVGVIMSMASSLLQANDMNEISNQNLSKRPYHQMPKEQLDNKADSFEGATVIKEAEKPKAGPTNYQRLRINMLSRQPYMEGKPE